MITVALWFIVSTGYSGSIFFSPPMPSQHECEVVKAKLGSYTSARCVQINTVQEVKK